MVLVFILDTLVYISSSILPSLQINYTFKSCCHIKMTSSLNILCWNVSLGSLWIKYKSNCRNKARITGLNSIISFGNLFPLASRWQKIILFCLFYLEQVEMGRIQNNILRMNQLEFKSRLEKWTAPPEWK